MTSTESTSPALTLDNLGAEPIKLVTFDLYDTLIELKPRRWERLHNALHRIGVEVDVNRLREADVVAEDYYTVENGGVPIRDRPKEEREAFRMRHMRVWLEAAGLEVDDETVRKARQEYLAEFEADPLGGDYRPFDDVMPALIQLREAGVKRAVISNADADVTELSHRMAFGHEMDAIITSAIVGYEKPDPRTFYAALEHPNVQVEPRYAIHVGDQPKSDIVGALQVGMRAALLDRYHRHKDGDTPAVRVTSLLTLAQAVIEHNQRVRAGA